MVTPFSNLVATLYKVQRTENMHYQNVSHQGHVSEFAISDYDSVIK